MSTTSHRRESDVPMPTIGGSSSVRAPGWFRRPRLTRLDRIVLAAIFGYAALLIGLGENAEARDYQNAGAVTGRALISEAGPVTVMASGLSAQAASEFALGMGIGECRSDLYDTDERDPMEPTTIVSDAGEAAQLYARRGRAIVEAMVFVRDLSNEPANVIYPESYVQRVRAAFAGTPGVSIRVLDVPAGMVSCMQTVVIDDAQFQNSVCD